MFHASARTAERIAHAGAGAVVLALVAAGLAGCTASTSATVKPAPVVLRIVTDDTAAKPAGTQILHLAAEVKRASHGSLLVKPWWHAAGDQQDFDQANARLVMDGTAALGLIPARAWDELGVTTLRPLTAPFLLTSDAQVRAAVTGPAVTPMLAGLSAAKVTGITLLPEGLRHPFGVGKPLLAAADYRGLIRTPTSATANALITALGGSPTTSDITQSSRGAESEYALAPSGTIATANVVLFPKVNALVANSRALKRLTGGQRAALQHAAEATQRWVTGSMDDRAAATTYCEQGGKVATASAGQLASLTAAAKPVRAQLERDPATKRILDMLVAEVGPAAPVVVPAACRAGASGTTAGLAAMQGTWLVPSTAEALRRKGVSDEGFINENAGTLIFTVSGDAYSWIQIPQHGYSPENPTGQGDLTSRAGAVTVYWSHAAGESATVTPRRTADGRLAFAHLTDPGADPNGRAMDEVQFASAPWVPLAKAIAGTWRTATPDAATLTLGDGRFSLHRPGGTVAGTYALHDQKVVLTWPTGGTTTATIGVSAEGRLVFQDPSEAGSRSATDRKWDAAAFASEWAKQ